MGELPETRTELLNGETSSVAQIQMQQPSLASMRKKRNVLGGPMNVEEIKMNRALLLEINQHKKQHGDRYTSNGSPSPDKRINDSPK